MVKLLNLSINTSNKAAEDKLFDLLKEHPPLIWLNGKPLANYELLRKIADYLKKYEEVENTIQKGLSLDGKSLTGEAAKALKLKNYYIEEFTRHVEEVKFLLEREDPGYRCEFHLPKLEILIKNHQDYSLLRQFPYLLTEFNLQETKIYYATVDTSEDKVSILQDDITLGIIGDYP